MLYMVTFTINIPQMLAYIPYMDPMGIYRIYPFPHSRQQVELRNYPFICLPRENKAKCTHLFTNS